MFYCPLARRPSQIPYRVNPEVGQSADETTTTAKSITTNGFPFKMKMVFGGVGLGGNIQDENIHSHHRPTWTQQATVIL